MEFGEKLQQMRKGKGLTQEELADAIYVSRAAISKWESGRGYPSIDSLKDISHFFDISIDDLLSVEKLLCIAQKENKSVIRNLSDLLFGIIDLFSLLFIVLPLYPNSVNDFIYSVNLLNYMQTSNLKIIILWCAFICLFVLGTVNVFLAKIKAEKRSKPLKEISLLINILLVLLLVITREAYAAVLAFLLLLIKTIIFIKRAKNG